MARGRRRKARWGGSRRRGTTSFRVQSHPEAGENGGCKLLPRENGARGTRSVATRLEGFSTSCPHDKSTPLARPRVARFPTPNRQEDAVGLMVMGKKVQGAKGTRQQIESSQNWLSFGRLIDRGSATRFGVRLASLDIRRERFG